MCVQVYVFVIMATENLSQASVMVVCVHMCGAAVPRHECCGGELCVCVCVGGESRCSGADSLALCILKPPSPPAAKIELGVEGRGVGEGVYGWWWWGEGGEARREEKQGGSDIAPQGDPSLSHLSAQFI